MSVAIDGPARPFFDAGRALYHQRQGQLDLACAQCHDQSWGKRLRVERISQGHATGFPIYRLEWQTLGSLHRRLRACFQGVRAISPHPSSLRWSSTSAGAPWFLSRRRRAAQSLRRLHHPCSSRP
jgi:hypothetical protein